MEANKRSSRSFSGAEIVSNIYNRLFDVGSGGSISELSAFSSDVQGDL
jgi:hypothetical protein